uniref:Uncharacterized protein n=1 Tax=Arundo donax TaxID=35708 RepID=A0A0A9HKY0_ARUDO
MAAAATTFRLSSRRRFGMTMKLPFPASSFCTLLF